MSNNTNIDVGYVAQLARLDLDEPTRNRLQHDLEAIIGYIDQLNELDVGGIEPTAHAVPLSNVWREDVAGASFERSTMLQNAPAVIDDELIKVPKVLPGEEM
ncbi:MAG: Asp-tRNA(Asn)/Glu-tRNA(Gln) amidotransferase subunit GatC [Victivallales bacterium]|nr:Asp-tRNA(Asn)/Glu-tRNA(Gln) amidotransferase subunit GatC [Victivallales bacterium]